MMRQVVVVGGGWWVVAVVVAVVVVSVSTPWTCSVVRLQQQGGCFCVGVGCGACAGPNRGTRGINTFGARIAAIA